MRYKYGVISDRISPKKLVTWGYRDNNYKIRAAELAEALNKKTTDTKFWRFMPRSEYWPRYDGCWAVWEDEEPESNEWER